MRAAWWRCSTTWPATRRCRPCPLTHPQRRPEPADGSRAQVHLEHARGLRSDVPKEFAPLLLPALLAEDYLNRLQACDFDGFHPALLHENGLASSPFPFQRRLAKHWLFGTY